MLPVSYRERCHHSPRAVPDFILLAVLATCGASMPQIAAAQGAPREPASAPTSSVDERPGTPSVAEAMPTEPEPIETGPAETQTTATTPTNATSSATAAPPGASLTVEPAGEPDAAARALAKRKQQARLARLAEAAPDLGAALVAPNALPGEPGAELATGLGAPVTDGESEADFYATQLERLRADYKKARALFGQDHVSIFPMIYAGRRCSDGSNGLFSGCDRATMSGVGAVIFVPVAGFGGGHGADWWPVLNTATEAEAFFRFEQRARKAVRVMAALSIAEPDVPTLVHYRVLATAFEDVLRRDIEEGGHADYRSRELLECLLQLTASDANAAEKVQSLDDLWREYVLLNGKQTYKRRHNLLVGPSYTVPLTEKITDLYLLGVSVEFGDEAWAVSLSGGLRNRYTAGTPVADAEGWYAGIGLSGELTEDLLDMLSGASAAAGQLKGAKP